MKRQKFITITHTRSHCDLSNDKSSNAHQEEFILRHFSGTLFLGIRFRHISLNIIPKGCLPESKQNRQNPFIGYENLRLEKLSQISRQPTNSPVGILNPDIGSSGFFLAGLHQAVLVPNFHSV